MLHPDTTLRHLNPVLGYGVVATRLIPRGTIVWVLDGLDQVFSPARAARLTKREQNELEKWTYTLPTGDKILNWDLSRYFNHSCNPTCMNTGMTFEIALRDIHPGEELNDDYGTLNKALPAPCGCGTPQCRGLVRADDMLRQADRWDAMVRAAFPAIAQVAQPLWESVPEKPAIARALEDPARIPSCRQNYCPAGNPA